MFWKNQRMIRYFLPIYDNTVNKINCEYVWKCGENNIFYNYLSKI